MKKILYILLAFLAVSCSKQKLADMNESAKLPTSAQGNTLFSNAEKSLSDQDVSLNVNVNDFDLWSQYLTETTYVDEANYDIFNRAVPDRAWRTYYHLLLDLNRASSLISEETTSAGAGTGAYDVFMAEQTNKLNIIEVLSCYAWDQLETTFGDIPYTNALDIENVLPSYDDALTIHKDLIARVKTAIAALDDSNGSFGTQDLLYNGDVSMWKAFANGLLVKMAIEISDVSSENALVKSTILAAKANTFASSADDVLFRYLTTTPYTNPLYVDLVLSGRSDFVAANTIIDAMTTLNDPRTALYFDQNKTPYIGGAYGHSSAFSKYTHINPSISNSPIFPHPLMTYSEVQFYLAEAAARNITSDDAATLYNNAVTASIVEWGGSTADATTYLAQPSVAYDAASWKDKIGTQAWLSFYLRGYTAFTEWRRLDAPTMNVPPSPASGVDTNPFRYPYPSNEQTLNGANYTAAAPAIGGDYMKTKLYWDKN